MFVISTGVPTINNLTRCHPQAASAEAQFAALQDIDGAQATSFGGDERQPGLRTKTLSTSEPDECKSPTDSDAVFEPIGAVGRSKPRNIPGARCGSDSSSMVVSAATALGRLENGLGRSVDDRDRLRMEYARIRDASVFDGEGFSFSFSIFTLNSCRF